MAEVGDAMQQALELEIHARLNATSSGHEVWECRGLAAALIPTVRALIADELRAAADQVDRGPTFPLSPSIISALIRERADDMDPR